MMQEQIRIGFMVPVPWDALPGQSLVALLALVGSKRMKVDALRGRTKLSPRAFDGLLGWLQQEYLVDVVTSLEGGRIDSEVALTDVGEATLIGLLERTCELPELR